MSEQKVRLDTFLEDIAPLVCNLYARWPSESRWEDFRDYRQPLIPTARKHQVKIIKMTKRPFGFRFEMEGIDGTFQLGVRTTQVYYKKI